MRDSVLIELAERWEREATTPECVNGSEEAKMDNAIASAERACQRSCADTLRTLVGILGSSAIIT